VVIHGAILGAGVTLLEDLQAGEMIISPANRYPKNFLE
jgi:hypothetical protein